MIHRFSDHMCSTVDGEDVRSLRHEIEDYVASAEADPVAHRSNPVPPELQDAVDSVFFIASHLKSEDQENLVSIATV